MASRLVRNQTVQLTDWKLFTNNGDFNNPLPPNRRLKKRNPYFVLKIDTNYARDRCSTARSRSNQVFICSVGYSFSSKFRSVGN